MASPEQLAMRQFAQGLSPEEETIPIEGPGSSVTESDDDYAAQSREISEYYKALEAEQIDKNDLLPPIKTKASQIVQDITNVLFHDEMAAVGVSVDQDWFNFKLETAKDAWVEHPLRSTIAVGLGIVPGLRMLGKSFTTAKYLDLPDDVLVQAKMVDDPAALARMTDADKRLLQQQAYNMQNMRELEDKIQKNIASPMEKAKFAFNKSFGNAYMERIDPDVPFSDKEVHINTLHKVMEGQEIHKHLKNLPDEKYGADIHKYLLDPNEIKNLPNSVKPWAINMGTELRNIQSKAVQEGFVGDDEAAQIGDIWFSTVRKGTNMGEQGPTQTMLIRGHGGKVQQLKVPRTSSPNLLHRASTQEEVRGLIDRQKAAEALEKGNRNQALSLLKGDKYAPYRELIEQGQDTAAISKLTEGGKIDLSPQSLTINSLLQQRLLFENYRYLRDVALNKDLTKTKAFVQDLSPAMRKQFVSLDNFEGSPRLRRMVARKLGKEGAVEELGYVHKTLFDQLVGADGQQGMIQGSIDMLGVLTALHKVSKTAWNVPTHGQNVLGNYAFLLWAGYNPFTKDALKLQGQSWGAIRKMQKASRSGRSLENIGDLGTIESKVGGNPISLMEEFNSNELKEIVEMSSLMSSEGVGVLAKIASKAKDHQTFTKKVIDLYQKGAQKTKLPEQLSDWYMAEDGYIKATYFLNLRQKGFSRAAAAREVGRRLPMYHSIGEVQKRARWALLPWISFPSEALRIYKNNMMDRPLSTAMMTHAVEGLQAVMYPWTGQSYEGLQDEVKNLAPWAQTPKSTVITPWRDKNDDIRAAVINSLPHLSFLPKTSADLPGFSGVMKKMPLGMDQPFPILNGIYHAMTGQDAWGREVPTGSTAESLGVVAANTVGFIAPPVVQKYMLNPSAPGGAGWDSYKFKQDFGWAVNPYTNKPGSAMYDMFINNIGLGGKFYPASAEQGLANERFAHKHLINLRSRLTREWSAFIKSGDYVSAADSLQEIKASFLEEWKDPAIAAQKEADWLKRNLRNLQQMPAMRGMSREQMLTKIDELTNSVGEVRSKALADRVALLRREAMLKSSKGRARGSGGYGGASGY